MPRVTQAHLDARRREILTAAFRCLSRKGFHTTTMQEIADEAGLSAGALYRYFEGKEALIEALASEGRDQKRGPLEALSKGEGANVLGRTTAEILQFLEAGDALDAARLDVRLWGEALDTPALRQVVADELEAVRAPIAEYVRREREAGRLDRDLDPDAISRLVTAILLGLALQVAFEPGLDVAACADVARNILGQLEER